MPRGIYVWGPEQKSRAALDRTTSNCRHIHTARARRKQRASSACQKKDRACERRGRRRMPSRGDNLHLAAGRGKTYRVTACLANDEDPNRLDARGRTPLTISIRRGHVEV